MPFAAILSHPELKNPTPLSYRREFFKAGIKKSFIKSALEVSRYEENSIVLKSIK
jgi:hypothetical protein